MSPVNPLIMTQISINIPDSFMYQMMEQLQAKAQEQIEQSVEKALEKRLGRSQNSDSKSRIYCTRKESCELLHIALPTLHLWTKEGRLTSYKVGGRVLYKAQELLDAVKKQ